MELFDRDFIELLAPGHARVADVAIALERGEMPARGHRVQAEVGGHPRGVGARGPARVVGEEMEPDVDREAQPLEPAADDVLDDPLADGSEGLPPGRGWIWICAHSAKLSIDAVS